MKNFLRRLGRTRFMILLFVLILAANYCYNGFQGLITATIGCCLGMLIYDWKEYKPRIIKFLRRRTKFQLNVMVKSIILIPIAIWCFWYAGWLGVAGAIIGVCVGELICRRFLNLK